MRLPEIFATMATLLALNAYGHTAGEQRAIEYPIVNFANTSTIDISEVVLTETATTLNIKSHFRPGWWIRISSDSYLLADGKKYAMTSTDGITPDSKFVLPESGEADFKLIFQPLPLSTKRFDFVEGDEDGSYRLLNVDLTGRAASQYPEGLPAELLNYPTTAPLPAPAFEMGKTTICVHMLPYVSAFSKGCIYVNTLAGTQEEYTLNFDSDGIATVSFDQYGPAHAFVTLNGCNVNLGSILLYPGETVNTYIDMRHTGQMAMQYRDKDKQGAAIGSIHDGRYAAFNHMLDANEVDKYFELQLYNGDFGDYHMSGPEYVAMVKDLYFANADSIKAQNWIPEIKESHLLRLQDDVMNAIANYKSLLMRNYLKTNMVRRNEVPVDSFPAILTDADFAEVASWFDISNPKLVIVGESVGDMDWNSHAGVKGDLSKSLMLYKDAADKALTMRLTPADLDSLKLLSNSFFATAVDSMAIRTQRKVDQIKTNASVQLTPEVANDKVFDAIIAPHKGKVVVVDLWNTWCVPCRRAIAENEPYKSTELHSDDIVFIYIADESSDPVKYLEMIPDIKGLHYKVNEQQIKAIRDRFNVDGIPYYIIVDRDGNAEGRPDLRDHKKYISTIKSKL